jgi:hypothetical protein
MHQVRRKAMIQKAVFMRNLSRSFDHFPNYHIIILLEKFDVKLGIENIFRLTTGNNNVHGDNGVEWWALPRLVVDGTIFLH